MEVMPRAGKGSCHGGNREHGGGLLEFEFPRFGDEIGTAPAFMFFLGDSFEAGILIEVAGSGEFALGPEHDFLVGRVAGKADAFGDQALADSKAAGGWLD